MLCLVAVHALVQLDDGTIVGDLMEKTTLKALDWKLSKGAHVSLIHVMLTKSCTAGDTIAPTSTTAQHCTQLVIRHHFQFFCPQAHVDHLIPARGKTLASVKGALEMIRGMLKDCPTWYDETYNI